MSWPSNPANVDEPRRPRDVGEQHTWLDALNVVCAVFTSDDANAARQIGNAERALHQLALRHERFSSLGCASLLTPETETEEDQARRRVVYPDTKWQEVAN